MAHHIDVTMKSLLRHSASLVAKKLFGGEIAEWLNLELPRVQNPRTDAVVRLRDGNLVHLEIENKNDAEMPVRMLVYYAGLRRHFGDDAAQVVVYVGAAPMRVETGMTGRRLTYSYDVIDIRALDGEQLLQSPDLGDNMLAILTLADPEKVIAWVLERLGHLPKGQRREAAEAFVILSGLRDLEEIVERRVGMLDLNEIIMENKVLGPRILEGERRVLDHLLTDRFGTVPDWAMEKMLAAKEPQMLLWAKRVMSAKTIGEVFAE